MHAIARFLPGAVLLLTSCTAASRTSSEAAASVGTPSSPVFQLRAESPADLRPTLQSFIVRAKIPGAAAVVLSGDHILAQGAAGVRKKGGTEAVTLDDAFEICSSTKAMTAALTAILICTNTRCASARRGRAVVACTVFRKFRQVLKGTAVNLHPHQSSCADLMAMTSLAELPQP